MTATLAALTRRARLGASAAARLRLLVWLAVALVAVVAAAAVATAAPADPVTLSAAGTSVPVPLTAPTAVHPSAADQVTVPDDPTDLLPAWRWRGAATTLYANTSWAPEDQILNGANLFASAFFMLASFAWGILLMVVKFGLTTDFISGAAEQINNGFAGFAETIGASGLVAVLLLVVMLGVARVVLRGNLPRALMMIAMFAIPLAGMQTMATLAGGGSGSGANYTAPTGSPAWIAQRGVAMTNQVGAALGSGFGATTQFTGSRLIADDSVGEPSCTAYNQALYSRYAAAVGGGGGDGLTAAEEHAAQNGGRVDWSAVEQRNIDALTDISSQSSVATVSLLWQRAFLGNWVSAQFGAEADGARAACHFLEHSAGITAAEQASVAGAAGYPGGANAKVWTLNDKYGTTDKDIESGTFAWIACTHNGSWQVQGGWAAGGADAGTCANWWSSGDVDNKWEWGDPNKLAAETQAANQQQVREVAMSFWGHNPGQRVMSGVMAAATAGFYLYALGGVALGSIVAQLGLVILLILLPGTLLLLALPQGRERTAPGVKLIRMTGGFFAGKLILTVVMTLLLQSILLFEAILNGNGGGLAGFASLIIPIGALVLVRQILKALGFGDISRVSGALGLSTAAAMSTGGRDMKALAGRTIGRAGKPLDDKASALGRAAGRTGLGALGKTAGATGRGSQAAAAAVGGAAARKMGLPERAALLMGSRDSDGSVVEQGTVGRLRALAAHKMVAAGDSVATALPVLGGGRGKPVPGLARLAAHTASQSALAEQQSARLHAVTARATRLHSDGLDGRPVSRQEARAIAEAEYIAGGEATLRAARLGSDDHVYLTPGEVAATQAAFAERAGLAPTQVLLGSSGIPALPVPPLGREDGSGRVPAAATDAQTLQLASHPVFYLPEHVKQRRGGESAEEYSRRLTATLVASGLMDPGTGDHVDVLKVNGIDIGTFEGREEVLKAARGQRSSLDGITIAISGVRLAALDNGLRVLAREEQGARAQMRQEAEQQSRVMLEEFLSAARDARGQLDASGMQFLGRAKDVADLRAALDQADLDEARRREAEQRYEQARQQMLQDASQSIAAMSAGMTASAEVRGAAQVVQALEAGRSTETLTEVFTDAERRAAHAQSQVETERSRQMRLVGALFTADSGEGAREALKALASAVRGAMSKAGEDVDASLASFEESQRMVAAEQQRREVLAVRYSGGPKVRRARDIVPGDDPFPA